MKSDRKIFANGRELRRLRKGQGLTQGQMAEKLGVTKWTYARYENGDRDVPESVLMKFAEIVDENPEEFRLGIRWHFDCGQMDSDFSGVRNLVNSVDRPKLRHRLIREFGKMMEGFKERIKEEVMDEK